MMAGVMPGTEVNAPEDKAAMKSGIEDPGSPASVSAGRS